MCTFVNPLRRTAIAVQWTKKKKIKKNRHKLVVNVMKLCDIKLSVQNGRMDP